MKSGSMDELVVKLEEFHKTFGIRIGSDMMTASVNRNDIYFGLLIEEVMEFRDAYLCSDNVKILDAFADIMFVLVSAIVENGAQEIISDVFAEVCRSNMTKLPPAGIPMYRSDGKIMKGDWYSPPDIKSIYLQYQEKVNSRMMKSQISES